MQNLVQPLLWKGRPSKFLDGTEPSAISAAVLRITTVHRVLQAHLARWALEVGKTAAKLWTNADTGTVGCDQAVLDKGIVDADLTLLRAGNAG